MNIRVDLNTSIKDGTEVVFRSPVDCSQVTGLIVYYRGADGNTASQEFMLADAHGNNVGDIDHLFAENVAVKVILDVTTGMAFVQNADTNAYLESRFNGIVDKLCPDFHESGAIVACEPVAGYPLTVQTDGATKVYRCGKNLLTTTIAPQTTNGITATVDKNGIIHLNGTATANAWFYITPTYPLPIADYVLSAHDYAPTADIDSFGFQYQDNTHNVFGLTSAGATVRSYAIKQFWRVEFRVPSGKTLNDYTMRIQLELGTVATAFERYRGMESFTAGEDIPALDGVNTVWADSGDVSVSGKADPVAVSRKQDERIQALEASLTALLEG